MCNTLDASDNEKHVYDIPVELGRVMNGRIFTRILVTFP